MNFDLYKNSKILIEEYPMPPLSPPSLSPFLSLLLLSLSHSLSHHPLPTLFLKQHHTILAIILWHCPAYPNGTTVQQLPFNHTVLIVFENKWKVMGGGGGGGKLKKKTTQRRVCAYKPTFLLSFLPPLIKNPRPVPGRRFIAETWENWQSVPLSMGAGGWTLDRGRLGSEKARMTSVSKLQRKPTAEAFFPS